MCPSAWGCWGRVLRECGISSKHWRRRRGQEGHTLAVQEAAAWRGEVSEEASAGAGGVGAGGKARAVRPVGCRAALWKEFWKPVNCFLRRKYTEVCI